MRRASPGTRDRRKAHEAAFRLVSARCRRAAGSTEKSFACFAGSRDLRWVWANQLDRLIKFDRGMACERARMLENRVRIEPNFTKPSNMIGAFKSRLRKYLLPFFRKS